MRQRQSKNDLTIEIEMAVEVADTSVHVNRYICCHRTHCLRQENTGIVANGIASCEWALIYDIICALRHKMTLSQTLSSRVNGPEPVTSFISDYCVIKMTFRQSLVQSLVDSVKGPFG